MGRPAKSTLMLIEPKAIVGISHIVGRIVDLVGVVH